MTLAMPERATVPSSKEFHNVVAKGSPIVLRRFVSTWKAVSLWGPEYFERTAGHRRVPIEFYPRGSYFDSRLTFEISLQQYIQLLRANNSGCKYYLAEVRLDEQLPELWADAACPSVIDLRRLVFVALFFGIDTASTVHYHATTHAILCQVVGRKKVTLYPPHDAGSLYFHPWYKYWFNFSRINFDRLDTARFPRYRDAVPLTCVLEPGDAVFIPLHWPHLVESSGTSASVTFFWRAHWHEWRLHPLAVRSCVASSFRTLISRPAAKACEKLFGFRVIW